MSREAYQVPTAGAASAPSAAAYQSYGSEGPQMQYLCGDCGLKSAVVVFFTRNGPRGNVNGSVRGEMIGEKERDSSSDVVLRIRELETAWEESLGCLQKSRIYFSRERPTIKAQP
ncbi:DNA directed RNA polymerase [Colletotrichum cuscutae]|uniref:DNA directed RNA polymerase n=1 Tax=Colletotrichum cuscutae TaxID=1209917 RepID=A0AAI9VDB8_9PEZI|nr:DNA directed RNA polymerase [Colletotrichum cuscutae]